MNTDAFDEHGKSSEQSSQKKEDSSNKNSSDSSDSSKKTKGVIFTLTLAALGVVFGDIGTSPLYAIRECFHGEYGIAVNHMNVLGILSLIFWSLIIVVTIKYLTFILKADNNGEGGVIALASLLKSKRARKSRLRWFLVAIGLFAASLLYGDGMITPSISVLSAVEGIRVIAPQLQAYVIPITVAILISLFLLQHHGTARVGGLFGPVILVWFSVLVLLGIVKIIQNPSILYAFSPLYGIEFLVHNHLHGFLVLGAVFLVVTGAEAIYADMGHFGRKPIRLAWIAFVLPALLMNYFGQGAILLVHPEEAHHPFYALVPSWAMIPMVILATTATIIASQAVITGAYSLTRQAIQLGYLPRMKVVHTSIRHIGQIYVPLVNWILMFATIGLVVGLKTSSKLAAAYGVAVTSTMLISTILFYVVAREKWGWNRFAAGLPVALFLIVDLAFFSANISKIFHGAWFPLVIGGAAFTLMMTWRKGREILGNRFMERSLSFDEFRKTIAVDPPQRIKGQAIFLTGNLNIVPSALLHNVKHNKILHSEIAFMHIMTEKIPRVPNSKKVAIEKLGEGFYSIIAHYGFMENPNMSNILAFANSQGLDLKIDKVSFFLGRENLLQSGKTGLIHLWKRLFIFMSRNSRDVAGFYGIPVNQVIEVGVQLQL